MYNCKDYYERECRNCENKDIVYNIKCCKEEFVFLEEGLKDKVREVMEYINCIRNRNTKLLLEIDHKEKEVRTKSDKKLVKLWEEYDACKLDVEVIYKSNTSISIERGDTKNIYRLLKAAKEVENEMKKY